MAIPTSRTREPGTIKIDSLPYNGRGLCAEGRKDIPRETQYSV